MFVFLAQILLATSLSATLAKADAAKVRGQLVRSGKQMFLVDEDLYKRKLIPGSDNVASDLESLHEGDFLAGDGQVDSDAVVLEDVEFIGLQRLLGRWYAREQGLVFDFQSFTDAAVKTFQAPIEKRLHYALVPDHGNRWTIFLGDQKTVVVGTLTYSLFRVQIDLINSNTGQIDQTIKMKPVP